MSRARIAVRAFAILALLTAPAPGQDDGSLPLPAHKATKGFDPRLDGVPFRNGPDYVNASGTCFGMSVTAIANWKARAKGQTRLDGVEAEAQVVAMQVAYEDELAQDPAFRARYVAAETQGRDAAATATRLRAAIAASGPRVIVLEGPGMNHAVVAYASVHGGFAVYDPDHPGERRTLGFDASDGFGGADFGRVTRLVVVPGQDSLVAQAERLRGACGKFDGTCVATFWKVDAHLTRTETALVVSGSVTGRTGQPALRPDFAVASVGGHPIARAQIPASGEIHLELPPGTKGPIRILAYTSGAGLDLSGFSPTALDPAKAPAPSSSPGIVSAVGGGTSR